MSCWSLSLGSSRWAFWLPYATKVSHAQLLPPKPITPWVQWVHTTPIASLKSPPGRKGKRTRPQIDPKTMLTDWTKIAESSLADTHAFKPARTSDPPNAMAARTATSRFIDVKSMPATTTPSDFRHMIKRTGIDPDRLVDVHIRYNKYLLPVGKAVLEFDSTQSASEFLAKGGQQTLAGQTLRMSSMDRDIDPSRLRPEVIGDAYGRCVLVYGFPKQITDSEMFEYFKSYQLAEQTESAIQRLPLDPPRIVSTRCVVHLATEREAERLVRDKNNAAFHANGSDQSKLQMIKATMLY